MAKMKKTILILVTIFTLMSCSKDDEKSDALEVTKPNLWGKWYFSEVIQPDGSRTPYVHQCATERDYIIFTTLGDIVFYHHDTNCTSYNPVGCTDVNLVGNRIIDCGSTYSGTVTLTTNTFKIDYDEVEFIGYTVNNFTEAKGIIFTKN